MSSPSANAQGEMQMDRTLSWSVAVEEVVRWSPRGSLGLQPTTTRYGAFISIYMCTTYLFS